MRPKTSAKQCECHDPGCDHTEQGHHKDTRQYRILYRIDMDDRSGTMMCHTCREDAMLCGLFTEDGPNA
jgi:hypothetical protein